MSDERNNLNQELVEHCAKAAQKDFGTYGMTGMQPDILWQAVAATVIHEAVLFLKSRRPVGRALLDDDHADRFLMAARAIPHRGCYWDRKVPCDCISIGDCPMAKVT